GYSAIYPCVTSALAAAATAWLLWAGTGGVFADWGVSLGTLTAFVLLLQRFFRPISALGEQWQQVQSALTGAERVFSVLALPPEAAAGPGASMSALPLGGPNGFGPGAGTTLPDAQAVPASPHVVGAVSHESASTPHL